MVQEILYRTDIIPDSKLIMHLYNNAGLKRPIENKERIEKMFKHSNIIITAWHNNILIGVSRAMADFGYWCFLADLAVNSNYQKMGIGQKLIDKTRSKAGKYCTLVLLSAPTAISYYERIGLRDLNNAFSLDREC